MGFLAPAFLAAAMVIGVPLALHLFHRHDLQRVSFPALRYLQRTERDHARRIRVRQLILLLMRIAIVLSVVAAGARLFVPGDGGSHHPTALAVVLDNSLSSGTVEGENRTFDRLRRLALETASIATDEDRIWVIRAAEPWDIARPMGPDDAAVRISSTEVTGASADLGEALRRARALVKGADLATAEIHLLSDLQATAFPLDDEEVQQDDGVPILVHLPRDPPPPNRYLHELLVGGGLPPLAGQRSNVTVTVGSDPTFEPQAVPLRLVVDDRIRGASSALPGRAVVMPLGPFPEGPVHGFIETDADALRSDDRSYFAFDVRPPPAVALAGEATFFLEHALDVLEEGGRLRRTSLRDANVLVSVGGAGSDTRRDGQAIVMVPSSDESRLPALNRGLATAGVPWRVERPEKTGEVDLGINPLPEVLGQVRAYDPLALRPTGGRGTAVEVPIRLADGEPWLVTGQVTDGAYALLGSALDESSTTLPVSAAMVPLLEWILSRLSASQPSMRGRRAGSPFPTPTGATHVRSPDGTTHSIDPSQSFRETRHPGIYAVLRGDTVLDRIAVNAPLRESLLARLEGPALEAALGPNVRVVRDETEWGQASFMSRQGPELWRPLLVAAFVLLLVESWIAAPGRSETGAKRRSPPASPAGETTFPASGSNP